MTTTANWKRQKESHLCSVLLWCGKATKKIFPKNRIRLFLPNLYSGGCKHHLEAGIYTLHNDIVTEKELVSVEKLAFIAEAFYPTCSIALFPNVVFFSTGPFTPHHKFASHETVNEVLNVLLLPQSHLRRDGKNDKNAALEPAEQMSLRITASL